MCCSDTLLPCIHLNQVGGEFAPHTDNEHLTMLIPLDSAGAFEGGGTAFWADSHDRPRESNEPPLEMDAKMERSTWLPPLHVLKPPAGTAIIFGGSVTHAGLPVTEGTRHLFVVSFTLVKPRPTVYF